MLGLLGLEVSRGRWVPETNSKDLVNAGILKLGLTPPLPNGPPGRNQPHKKSLKGMGQANSGGAPPPNDADKEKEKEKRKKYEARPPRARGVLGAQNWVVARKKHFIHTCTSAHSGNARITRTVHALAFRDEEKKYQARAQAAHGSPTATAQRRGGRENAKNSCMRVLSEPR